jgi:hypothetical protein
MDSRIARAESYPQPIIITTVDENLEMLPHFLSHFPNFNTPEAGVIWVPKKRPPVRPNRQWWYGATDRVKEKGEIE